MLADEEHSAYSPSYTSHFRHIESKIYPLLCQLKMAILNKGAQLPHISNDVMHTSLRNVDTHALRHMRDYRILKDIVRLFHSIQGDYGNIHAEDQVNVQVENRWSLQRRRRLYIERLTIAWCLNMMNTYDVVIILTSCELANNLHDSSSKWSHWKKWHASIVKQSKH
jgi:hypothetical protein